MQVKKKTARQLSIAIGLLSFAAFVIQGLGKTWGFEAIADQLAQSALVVVGGFNIYFFGATDQKNRSEKEANNGK